VQEFVTTRQGYRLATSNGGVLTGRGADIILIADPLKPEEALSDTQRQAANDWFDHTLYSRQNDKRHGAIVIIMQRLHEDDLVGHVLGQEPWEVVCFPAIAEADEVHRVETIWGPQCFTRHRGQALHPDREPLDTLDRTASNLYGAFSVKSCFWFVGGSLFEAGKPFFVPSPNDQVRGARRRGQGTETLAELSDLFSNHRSCRTQPGTDGSNPSLYSGESCELRFRNGICQHCAPRLLRCQLRYR
jgi:hypothetical protein